MLLIVAAMDEELRTGLDLCRDIRRADAVDARVWRADYNGRPVHFLKAGVGPAKAAASLERTLHAIAPDQILVIGYAGALDPGLELGSLVAGTRTSAFSLDRQLPDWNHVQLDGTYALTHTAMLEESAKSAGLKVCAGAILSSSHVLGNPRHKASLHDRFQAAAVDMETAFLARVAAAVNIPMSCVRAISDEAGDTFLEPFAYDPSANLAVRARKLLDTGMAETYREWKSHAAVAKASLSRFCEFYLRQSSDLWSA